MGCNNSAPVANNNDAAATNADAGAAAPAPAVENTATGESHDQQGAKAAPKKKSPIADKWTELSKKLPRTRSAEDTEARQKLFSAWDPNGNGMLSLAEIDKGARDLGMANLTDNLSPILLRAYVKARDIGTKNGDKDDRPDFVNANEFRLLLVYIYDYFELYVAFDEIDTSDDRRVTLAEFKKAVPRLQQWGVAIADADAEFKSMDKNGGGVVLFDEFSEWAIEKHLDVDGKENVA